MLIETRKPTPDEKIAHSVSASRRSVTVARRAVHAGERRADDPHHERPADEAGAQHEREMHVLVVHARAARPSVPRSTSTSSTAPLPGSVPTSPRRPGRAPSSSVAAVTLDAPRELRRDVAPARAASAPPSTRTPSQTRAPRRARGGTSRRDTRQANTAPVSQSARSDSARLREQHADERRASCR